MKYIKSFSAAVVAVAMTAGTVSSAHATGTIRKCVVTVPSSLKISQLDQTSEQILENQSIVCPTGTFNIGDGLVSFNAPLWAQNSMTWGRILVATRQIAATDGTISTKNFIEFDANGAGTFKDAYDVNQYADGVNPLPNDNSQMLIVDPNGSNEIFAVTLSNPVLVKYRTDVSATAKRSGHSIKIKIVTSRNQYLGLSAGFWGQYGASLKIQDVLPNTKADHAIVKRDGKIIARVKLNKFGEANYTTYDPSGKNHYTVTMVATPTNYEGKASFIK